MLQTAAATKKMELYSRRPEMYCLHIAELHISEIIKRLSVKYRVSKRVFRRTGRNGLSGCTTSLTSSRLRRRGRHNATVTHIPD
jgi:hypothetical protein